MRKQLPSISRASEATGNGVQWLLLTNYNGDIESLDEFPIQQRRRSNHNLVHKSRGCSAQRSLFDREQRKFWASSVPNALI